MNNIIQPGLVSVIMPAFNAEQFIGKAINSAVIQNYTNWELIIVNDGSTDSTATIASQFVDPRIKLFYQENAGEAVARNTALSHIQGEFVAFLDADDQYLANHLEETCTFLQTHPDYGGVYTDGYYIDEKGSHIQTLSSRRRGPFEGNVFEEVVFGSDVFGPPVCVVLRRSLVTQHRLKFDENIVIGPDWDFFAKFAEIGLFGFLPQKTCLYRVHLTNITLSTSLERRALELAKCRMNAIKLQGFFSCSEGTQFSVFYDLLVNLLRGYSDYQKEIIEGPEFKRLGNKIQARLLRLMASKTLVYDGNRVVVNDWLEKSRNMDPGDWSGKIVFFVYRISPTIVKVFLHIKNIRQIDPRQIPPFADLKIGQ